MDYLQVQKKTKRTKNEYAEYDFMSMNFANGSNALSSSTTTMSTSSNNMHQPSTSTALVPQIINVNQYTNQTYVINNISTNQNGAVNNGVLGSQNYANSYYGWPTANYNPDPISNLSNSYAQYNPMQSIHQQQQPLQQPMQIQQQQQQQQLQFNQSSTSAVNGLEDTLGSPIKEMIKNIHECYQKHLSPLVLLKKDLFSYSSMGSGNSKINNTFNNGRPLAIAYHGNQNLLYNNHYPSSYGNDLFAENMKEITEHFKFYALKLADFLNDLSRKFAFF
jgi:hypothetical protein